MKTIILSLLLISFLFSEDEEYIALDIPIIQKGIIKTKPKKIDGNILIRVGNEKYYSLIPEHEYMKIKDKNSYETKIKCYQLKKEEFTNYYYDCIVDKEYLEEKEKITIENIIKKSQIIDMIASNGITMLNNRLKDNEKMNKNQINEMFKQIKNDYKIKKIVNEYIKNTYKYEELNEMIKYYNPIQIRQKIIDNNTEKIQEIIKEALIINSKEIEKIYIKYNK